MPRKKRPFIDRKNDRTTTFALVHRSQKDPLAADDTAPQRVLQPFAKGDVEKRKEEEREFGIFYDDDYDYLQHLKNREEAEHDWEEADRFLIQADPSANKQTKPKPFIQYNLPSSVFASAQEEDVGLLNRAAPRSGPLIDWDPDIVETLDDAFEKHDVVIKVEAGEDDGDDAEDELDLLLAQANDDADDDDEYEDVDEDDDSGTEKGDGDDEYDSEADDDVPSLEGGFSFSGEETKSKFTSYSLSSSVIRRNKDLVLLDDKFDKFIDGYEDENIGGLDCEEIEGSRPEDSDVMKQILSDFEKQRKLDRQIPDHVRELGHHVDEEDEDDDKEVVELHDTGHGVGAEDKWDCESILSTYSNIYNHPKLISEPRRNIDVIRVSGKTGIPKDVLGKGLTAGALKQLDRQTAAADEKSDEETMTLASRVSALSVRNRHETKEEKKSRKTAVKELKQERRQEKKANTLAFKEEKVRQEKISLNTRNSQGLKLL